MNCSQCKGPLTETNFNKHFVYLCLNWQCSLYRRVQETRTKIISEVKSRKDYPSYGKKYPCRSTKGLEHRKVVRYQRYHAIRSLGVGSIRAQQFRDRWSMTIEEVKEVINDN